MRVSFLAGLALVLASAHPSRASGFTQIFVFGDSLSDVGNNGRYSDGYLWDEHVAGAYGVTCTPSDQGGTDYAVSGALITSGQRSLPNQVSSYLAAHPDADPNALYAIWGGGNDVLATIGNAAAGPAIQSSGVSRTVAMLKSLYKAGARQFLVGMVPHTDLTPEVQSDGKKVVQQQAALVTSWNTALVSALASTKLPGARLWRYDSAAYMSGAIQSPTHFGFTSAAACDNTCADPDHTFFWDKLHPASTAHAQIGAAIFAELNATP